MAQSIFKSVFANDPQPKNTQTAPTLRKVATALPRLFVIDDDPTFCKLMERVAKQQGFHIQAFQTIGQLGETELSAFDVGIVDFDLGCVDGVEMASYIENQLGQIPLVFVSGTDRRRELTDRRGAGQVNFISKKDGPNRILELCTRCFSG